MKKTLLTIAVLIAGISGTKAQEPQTLLLDDSKDLVPVINAAAEAGGTYYVTFSDRSINMNYWNVFCLPFDATPAEISKAFYYLAVDLVMPKSEDGNIHFEQPSSGTIPAGTPFLFKSSNYKKSPKNFNQVTFMGPYVNGKYQGVTLKKVKASYTVEDNYHNRFISTFSPVSLYGKDIWYMSKGKWFDARNYSKEKPVNLKPLRAYVDFSQNTTTEAPMIIIDEPDGTTTVIDAISFNKGEFSTDSRQDDAWYTVAGTRLTGEPTAKGVYIHQSRKVIIK